MGVVEEATIQELKQPRGGNEGTTARLVGSLVGETPVLCVWKKTGSHGHIHVGLNRATTPDRTNWRSWRPDESLRPNWTCGGDTDLQKAPQPS